MSGYINKVQLIGNLGRDPEIRHTQDGSKLANLNIATSEYWKDKSTNECKERTEWHKVVIFNDRIADVAEKYLRKGSKVYIEGQLQTRKWDKDGVDHYTTEVVLQRFKGEMLLMDSKGSQESPTEAAPFHGGGFEAAPQPLGRDESKTGSVKDALNDEIPF